MIAIVFFCYWKSSSVKIRLINVKVILGCTTWEKRMPLTKILFCDIELLQQSTDVCYSLTNDIDITAPECPEYIFNTEIVWYDFYCNITTME